MSEFKIQQLLQSQINFYLGDTLKESWKIFLEKPVLFLGYTFLLSIIYSVLVFIPIVGQFAGLVVMGPLQLGYIIAANKIYKKEPLEFNDFFKGFQNLAPVIVISILSAIIVSIGFLLLVIPGIYLAVGFQLAYPIYYFSRIEGWPALDSSRKLIHKIWWPYFGLIIVLAIINFAGMLAFGVGLLLTISLTGIVPFVAYKNIVGLEESEMRIEDHLI